MDKFLVTNYTSFWSVLRPLRSIQISVEQALDWRVRASMLLLIVVQFLSRPLKHLGRWLEMSLNLVSANGGLFKTLYTFATNPRAIVFVPEGSEKYLTVVSHIEPRTDLLSTPSMLGDICPDSKEAADLCIMASKIAYENPEVIKAVVEQTSLQMHLIGTYEYWNEFQEANSTQAFMFADRKEDAQVIILAFRGTEVFNGYDWCTDFDFSWYQLPQLGRVHLGFLEALGLGDRKKMETFHRMKANIYENAKTPTPQTPTSGLPDNVMNQRLLAYDHISQELLSILSRNKHAKIYITGHSLGGALAIVFTAMLFYYQDVCRLFHSRSQAQEEVTKRIAAVYTFGQPRVGDDAFVSVLKRNLNESKTRYFRIVYNNDVVPRVPFDDSLFGFKHVGWCFYFNYMYNLEIRPEEPNPNYFHPVGFLLARVQGLLELLHNGFFGYRYGEEFQDTILSTVVRLVGVLLPGAACHSLVNYINSVRLGPDHLDPMCPSLQCSAATHPSSSGRHYPRKCTEH